MIKKAIDVKYGKKVVKDAAGKETTSYEWKLSGLMLTLPEATLEAWKAHLGEKLICDTLEEYSSIRIQDAARNLHKKDYSDANIRIELQNWKLGTKLRVAAKKKTLIEVAQERIASGQKLTAEEVATLMQMIAEASENEAEEAEVVEEEAVEE